MRVGVSSRVPSLPAPEGMGVYNSLPNFPIVLCGDILLVQRGELPLLLIDGPASLFLHLQGGLDVDSQRPTHPQNS